MRVVSALQRLRSSLANSTGTIVFGMEDGTVSIFGLIFGVAATTSSTATVLIAGASGAVAAAVSMMAGAYLDVETTRDEIEANRALMQDDLTLEFWFHGRLPIEPADQSRPHAAAIGGTGRRRTE